MAGGPTLVQRAVDLNYWSRKRATGLRWSAVNAAALLVLAYDLSCKCPGYTSPLHYVEMFMAAVACANLLQYALQLLPRACTAAPLLSVTPAQRQLLGLSDSDLGDEPIHKVLK
ncbi:uncharacterized protein LOC113239026 [Hyposmocoma kahamanoa]|uniref:uncharacterized protein LOC113239026 n=1 Tax=Hyposmocoma kahamanoa TaxID=1477025 RepID=UPI000E6D94B8|nr:uncharacterized protein LOC113239026 [Hyposmocoma kahamanoa]